MKLSVPVFILLSGIISVSLIGVSSSFAQSNSCPSCLHIAPENIDLYKKLFPLIMWTDSQIYDHDSVVKIMGHLRPQNNVAPIIIMVTNPLGNVVTIDQITPDANGNFSFSLNTKSPLWKQNGDYIVKAQSGSDTRQFKIKFTLIPNEPNIIKKCKTSEFQITSDIGDHYCISYTSSTGTMLVSGGKLKLDTAALMFTIKGSDAGSILFNIPRNILDSRSSSGGDSDFLVLYDGQIIEFQQLEENDDIRQIKIDYLPTRDGTYEIIGTHVIPEFGSVVLLVMAGSIISALVLGKSLSNRFVKF